MADAAETTPARAAPNRSGWLDVKAEYVIKHDDAVAAEAAAAESAGEVQKPKAGRNKAARKGATIGMGMKHNMLDWSVAHGRPEECDKLAAERKGRFTDAKAFWEVREPEIADECPLYAKYGACPAGLNCRFGSCIDKEALKPRRRPDATSPPVELCALPQALVDDIRNKRYTLVKAPSLALRLSKNQQRAAKRGRKRGRKARREAKEAAIAAKKASLEAASNAAAAASGAGSPSTAAASGGDGADTGASVEAVADVQAAAAATGSGGGGGGGNGRAAVVGMVPRLGPREVVAARRRWKERLPGSIYIAPLTTIGNLPFRRAMRRLGADITVSEMAVASEMLVGSRSEWALLRRHPDESNYGAQLAVNNGADMARVAEVMEREFGGGSTGLDFVDINMGCPIDMVYKQGMGSALMGKGRELRDIIRAANQHMSIPLTLKMRTAISPKEPLAGRVIRIARSIGGVGAVALHGRTRLQRYTKAADWEAVAKMAALATQPMRVDEAGFDLDSYQPGDAAHWSIDAFDPNASMEEALREDAEHECAPGFLPPVPFIGNGDIMSFTEWNEHLAIPGLSTCMLGRGAIIKPWLCTEIKEQRHWDISSSERLDILKDFVHDGLEHWGSDPIGVDRTRRYLLEWLSFLHRYVPVGLLERVPQQLQQRPPPYCGRDELETIMASADPRDWIRISEMLLGKVPEGFRFEPKHRANSYATTGGASAVDAVAAARMASSVLQSGASVVARAV